MYDQSVVGAPDTTLAMTDGALRDIQCLAPGDGAAAGRQPLAVGSDIDILGRDFLRGRGPANSKRFRLPLCLSDDLAKAGERQ